MENILFRNSRPFTLGVELEFQILDRKSLSLVPKSPQIMQHFIESHRGLVASEFLQSIIEVQTSICDSVDQVEQDLRRTVMLVEDVAREHDSILFSSSLHPFACPGDQKVTEDERYQRIMDELQLVGRQFFSQGMHVHIGMESCETAITVWNILQAYLPLFLGLSSSSPYFCGEDTGFCSYRTKLFEALPLAGIAGYLEDWQHYECEIQMLKDKKIIAEVKDLWWDVRLSPNFGTVEVRICDIPSRYQDILALTALIQALTAFIVASGVKALPVSPQLLKYNKWQAARHGLDGWFHDPFGIFFKKRIRIRGGLKLLVEILKPTMEKLGSAKRGGHLVEILKNGTSSHRQRKLMQQKDSFLEMIQQIHSEFWA